MIFQRFILLSLISLVLVSCGGGSQTNSNLKTGVLLDSAVDGLVFKTENGSGITKNGGEFSFQEGESIQFYLGKNSLGETNASNILTLLDLVPEDAHQDTLINILQLLQSLDDDDNPENGIYISSEINDYANNTNIDFSVSQKVFSNNQNVLALLAISGKTSGLVDPGRAALHFQMTLSQENIQQDLFNELYSVGGVISGLKGNLKLSNYGLDELEISNLNQFSFQTKLPDNFTYHIEILEQPKNQSCRLINAEGMIKSSDVSSISIYCEDVEHKFNASVSGLNGSLILASSSNRYFISSNGGISIASDPLAGELIIEKQPINQQCEILPTATAFNIVCSNERIELGGSITGLLSGLTLQNIDGSLLYISENGKFSFPENYLIDQAYELEIVKQPIGQTCIINNASGSFADLNANLISIECDTAMYDVNINIQGLENDFMPIYINDSQVDVDSSGNLIKSVTYLEIYELSFDTPVTKVCEVSSGLAKAYMPASNVEITIACTDVIFQYKFVTDNYIGMFELLNNDGNPIVIDSDVVYGATDFGTIFNFNIKQHPSGQTCSVDTASDSIQTPITVIDLTCVNNPVQNINLLPIANVGIDTSVSENSTISLDGSASSDPDGIVTNYNWTQIAGPEVTLNNSATATPSFATPSVIDDTVFTFALVVTDDGGDNSIPATLNILVQNVNQLPIAHAGSDIRSNENSSVQLDGGESFDPDGQINGFSWRQTGGDSVTLIGANTVTPSFIAPEVSSSSTFTFDLVVTDNDGASSDPATVSVTVLNINQLPVAHAGGDIAVNENVTVNLNGNGSSDLDGTIINYSWTQTSGDIVSLSGANTSTPSFNSPSVNEDTTLTFDLVVTDNDGASSDPATVSVTVLNINQLPVAHAGGDIIVNENVTVSLNGNGSSDLDGSITKYSWTQSSGDIVSLSGANTSIPSFNAPSVNEDTTLTFDLVVTDNDGASSSPATMKVTVKNVNQLPLANTGGDIRVNENTTVNLNGKGSSDPDGFVRSYQWIQIDGELVTLNGANTATPSFIAPNISVETTFSFELIVTDNDGASSIPDTLIVTIQNVNQLPEVTIVSNGDVDENVAVSLDGSTSSDSDGFIETYSWEKIAGPNVILNVTNTDTLSFTSPEVISDESISFRLTVTDNDGASSYGDITFNVNNVNQLPIAITGIDQTVKTESLVTLDGSNSEDPDGVIQEYTWTQLSGTNVSLSDSLSMGPSFSAPLVTTDEILEFQLVVTDNETAIGITTTQITVTPHQSYYILNPNIQNQDLSVASLSDNNTITVGQTVIVLDKNQRGTIPAAELNQGSQISGTSNFDVASDEDGTDMLVPAQFLGTTFVVPHFRSSHTYYLLSPNVDATVTITIDGASTELMLNAGIVNEFAAGSNNTISGIISSDQNILVVHSSNNKDVFAVPPVANEITGIRTSTVIVGALEDNTAIIVTASNGSSETQILSSGERLELTTGSSGSDGQGNAYYIEADKPIAAVQAADSDGSEATAFWSLSHLATHYVLPINAQYIAVSCFSQNVEVKLTDGVNTQTEVCDSNGTVPGKAYFGSSIDGIHVNAGAILESTAPIYVIYEASSSNDEHNLLGNVQ